MKWKVFCLLIVCGHFVLSQSLPPENKLPFNVVEPSPNSISLQNVIAEDVQRYTGTMTLQIPIFNLKSRSLELPISINYAASGIKVNEIGSWVGLGFSLQAGGVISRVMRGIPDEYDGQLPKRNAQNSSWPAKGWLDPEVRGSITTRHMLTHFGAITDAQREELIKASAQDLSTSKIYDTEPDEFYFSFAGYSGKFIFDEAGLPLIIPHQNLKIININFTSSTILGPPSRRITSFDVIDGDGIIYTFGNKDVAQLSQLTAVEMTTHSFFNQMIQCERYSLGHIDLSYDPDPNLRDKIYVYSLIPFLKFISTGNPDITVQYGMNYLPFSSSWYLTKIETPNQDDFISLSYTNEDIEYMTYHKSELQQLNLDSYQGALAGFPNSFAGTLRRYEGSKLLDEMGYTNPHPTLAISSGYNSIKSKKLSQITTASGATVSLVSSTSRRDLNGAKLLDQISVTNSENEVVKKVSLNYEYTDSRAIGNNGGTYTDVFNYWFRYRNAQGDYPLWAIREDGYRFGTEGQYYNYDWRDRWKVMAEADYFRLFLKDITEISATGGFTKICEFVYPHNGAITQDNLLPRRLSFKQDHWGYYNTNSVGHTIPPSSYTSYWGSTVVIGSGLVAIGSPKVYLPFFQTNLMDQNGNPVDPDPTYVGANRSPNLLRSQAGVIKEVMFATGAKKTFEYDLNNVSGSIRGGLVVKSIKHFPNASINLSENTQYNYFNGKTRGYNLLAGSLKYLESWDLDQTNLDSRRNQVVVSSEPLNGLPLTKGYSVGYRTVEEFKSGAGKRVYTFKDPTNVAFAETQEKVYNKLNVECTDCNGVPYAQFDNNDHMMGLLEKIENFDFSNNQYRLLDSEEYTYAVNPAGFTAKTVYGFRAGIRDYFTNSQGQVVNIKKYYAGFYKYKNDFVALEKKTSTLYDQSDPGNESKKMVLSTVLSYGRSGQTEVRPDLLPRKIIQNLPSGEKMITETMYTQDYSFSGIPSDITSKGIYLLQSRKIDNAPIEVITYIDALGSKYLVDANLTRYKEFQAGKVYASEKLKLKSGIGNSFTNYVWASIDGSNNFLWPNSASFKLSSSINNYDLMGNPTEIQNENGLPMNFIWGYGGSLLSSASSNPGSFQHTINYLYKPLVGVTQISDPNSRNLNFSYDNYRRLKSESDHSSQIQNIFKYNFKNSPSNNLAFNFSMTASSASSCVIQYTVAGQGEPGTSLIWDFGNGVVKENGTATEFQEYFIPGTYTVKLATKHSEYPSSVTTKAVIILPPVAVQITSPTIGTSRTVCGNHTTVCQATTTGGPYNYQWEYQYSGSGSNNWVGVGTNSPQLSFSITGAQGTFNAIRCKITDENGNSRYSSPVTVYYYCSGQGGPNDCPSGWTWNAQLGRCDPPTGFCGEGCFWNGTSCVCN